MPLVFSFLYHHPVTPTYSCHPQTLILPGPPAGASAVWRGLRFQDLRRRLLAREKARGTRMGETGFLVATGFKGPWGSLKTDFYLFLANFGIWRGGGGGG